MTREQELEKHIKELNKMYWEENNENIIPDENYDDLVRELKELNPNNPVLNTLENYKIDTIEKISHRQPMLSLDKVYSVSELLEWAKSVSRNYSESFSLENKYDGWSVERWNDFLSTRGDGYIGEDISKKMVYIKNLNECPQYIHSELLMLKSDFEKYKDKILRKNGSQYKTPRTILTGILSSDDIITNEKILTLMPFNSNNVILTYKDLVTFNWDLFIEERKNADYPIDGLVLKLMDEEYGKSLGSTTHHVRSAMALKFTNPTGITVLKDIFWSSGKFKLTPVAIVEPVEIGGVIVDSPNLHNYKYILDKDIQIGDTLILERCGDIIPDVKEVIPGKDRMKVVIDRCPYCQFPVFFNDTDIVCTNTNCIGMAIQRLCDAIARIGIEELGEPTVEKLIGIGYEDLIDIFELTIEDIKLLEGFADTSSKNLYDQIQKVKHNGVYEWQILASLNLFGIGETISKTLLKEMSLNGLRNKTLQELEKFSGIGPERAKEIYYGLQHNDKYINNLCKILKVKETPKETRKICFTGKMPKDRSYYFNLAKEHDWTPVDKVTKELGLLVHAVNITSSTKLAKAKKYGVEIMNLEEFLHTIGEK